MRVILPCLLTVIAFLPCGEAGRASAQIVLPPELGAPLGGTVPTERYDLAVAALAEGRLQEALGIATDEFRGGVKAGGQRWIDSIASSALVGECLWELGQFREAVDAYDQALLLAASNANWMLAVQFPPQGPRPLARAAPAPWGPGSRNATPGMLPDTMQIRIEGPDPQQVLQRGGVLAAPVNALIHPLEIVRGIVVSLYRRADILGELSIEGTSLEQAARMLATRPAPPNHYSQAWIDIALGIATWAQGRPDAAVPLLRRGLLMGNTFDHPMAAWGLIVLGRIAIAKDDAAAAARWFEEATLTAYDHGDARAMEEAFRWALSAHMAAGTRGVPRSLAVATEWSRDGGPSLRTRLLALSAEALAVSGNAAAASGTLQEIDPRVLRGDLGRSLTGAQAAYAAALVGYLSQDAGKGDAELVRAVGLARGLSPRLFQTQRLVQAVLSGATVFSDRQADVLFSRLLADPSPRETLLDPLGSLAAAATPKPEAFDAWITVAARRGIEPLMVAAEAAKRARWLDTQPLGGRRTAIIRLVAADAAELPAADAVRRAAMLAANPQLAKTLGDGIAVRTRLSAAVHAAAGQRDAMPVAAGEAADWNAFRDISARQSRMISLVAAGREPVRVEFPPLFSVPEIRQKLKPRQLVLSFHWNAAGLLATLESNERITTWQVRQPAAVARDIVSLAKELCLFDAVTPVGTDKLADSNWRSSAERIERGIFDQSRVSLAEGIDELVIVPDGMLWYLPFELLPVGSGREAAENRRPLRECCRIRYAPSRSLAVMPMGPRRLPALVGIAGGRLHRSETPEQVTATLSRLLSSLPQSVVIQPPQAAGRGQGQPLGNVAPLVDTLVVLEEIPGLPAGWLELPEKRPAVVLLPCFQSAAASGLTKLPARPGNELFLAATDLAAAGARTSLVSRWNVGGRMTIDLVEEFVRDASAPPSDAWRRAVEVVMREPPDPALEPRLKPSSGGVLEDASHPFFWAGFMLVDCGGEGG